MKRLLILAASICILFSCNELKEDAIAPYGTPSEFTLQDFDFPHIEIDALNGRLPIEGNQVYQLAERLGGSIQDFDWSMADDHMVWSSVIAGDSTLSVGYQPEGLQDIYSDLKMNKVNEGKWKEARDYTVAFILKELHQLHPEARFTEADLNITEPNHLPILWLTLPDYEAIAKLRKLPTVRYVEPLGYDLEASDPNIATRSGLGCGDGGSFTPILNQHHTSFTGYSGSKVSWHLTANGIKDAWDISQGDNVTIGMLDTGISPDQDMLKSPEFTWGPSASRTITKDYSYSGPYSWSNQNDGNDRCGHGTTIAGQLVGPVNNNGAITGIAYKANLYSMRAGNDVWINSSKAKQGFVNGLADLAALSTIKVINIAMGRKTKSSDIETAVNSAAVTNGKILVCAAGSGASGALYPAKYSNAIGVTAVEYRPSADPSGTALIKAGSNSKGSHVDFSVYLYKEGSNNSDIWALGMRQFVSNPREAVGSSAASATISGMIALIWSANPSLTKYQVIQFLKENASYYPGKDSDFGWGVVDAEAAVIAANNLNSIPLNVSISGPSFISSSGNYTWSSQVSNASGSKTYKWYWNGTLVSSNINYSRYVSTDGVYNSDQLKLVVTTSSGQSDDSIITIYNI